MTTTKASRPEAAPSAASPPSNLKFRLYVAGQTPRSLAAIANIHRICRENFPGRNSVEVIDLMANPALAKRDDIVAIPTLIRLFPKPIRQVIGDLSSVERVLEGLEVASMQGALSLT